MRQILGYSLHLTAGAAAGAFACIPVYVGGNLPNVLVLLWFVSLILLCQGVAWLVSRRITQAFTRTPLTAPSLVLACGTVAAAVGFAWVCATEGWSTTRWYVESILFALLLILAGCSGILIVWLGYDAPLESGARAARRAARVLAGGILAGLLGGTLLSVASHVPWGGTRVTLEPEAFELFWDADVLRRDLAAFEPGRVAVSAAIDQVRVAVDRPLTARRAPAYIRNQADEHFLRWTTWHGKWRGRREFVAATHRLHPADLAVTAEDGHADVEGMALSLAGYAVVSAGTPEERDVSPDLFRTWNGRPLEPFDTGGIRFDRCGIRHTYAFYLEWLGSKPCDLVAVRLVQEPGRTVPGGLGAWCYTDASLHEPSGRQVLCFAARPLIPTPTELRISFYLPETSPTTGRPRVEYEAALRTEPVRLLPEPGSLVRLGRQGLLVADVRPGKWDVRATSVNEDNLVVRLEPSTREQGADTTTVVLYLLAESMERIALRAVGPSDGTEAVPAVPSHAPGFRVAHVPVRAGARIDYLEAFVPTTLVEVRFPLPDLPGAPPENRGVTNLLEAHVPCLRSTTSTRNEIDHYLKACLAHQGPDYVPLYFPPLLDRIPAGVAMAAAPRHCAVQTEPQSLDRLIADTRGRWRIRDNRIVARGFRGSRVLKTVIDAARAL